VISLRLDQTKALALVRPIQLHLFHTRSYCVSYANRNVRDGCSSIGLCPIGPSTGYYRVGRRSPGLYHAIKSSRLAITDASTNPERVADAQRIIVHVNELIEPRLAQTRVAVEPTPISHHGLNCNGHQSRPRAGLEDPSRSCYRDSEIPSSHINAKLKYKLIMI
jgi:hypothetical protein